MILFVYLLLLSFLFFKINTVFIHIFPTWFNFSEHFKILQGNFKVLHCAWNYLLILKLLPHTLNYYYYQGGSATPSTSRKFWSTSEVKSSVTPISCASYYFKLEDLIHSIRISNYWSGRQYSFYSTNHIYSCSLLALNIEWEYFTVLF